MAAASMRSRGAVGGGIPMSGKGDCARKMASAKRLRICNREAMFKKKGDVASARHTPIRG